MKYIKAFENDIVIPKYCDHKSVGIIIYNEKKEILLIERGTFPFKMAPPAGHVDKHSSFEDAAKAEVNEEVGLSVTSLKLLGEGKKVNPCRRIDGDWHYWKIFKARTIGSIKLSEREAKRFEWCNNERLIELKESQELEEVWVEWLTELNIIK